MRIFGPKKKSFVYFGIPILVAASLLTIFLVNGSPAHAGTVQSTATTPPLPPITGHFSDSSSAQQIESVSAQYLELRQSILIPNATDSSEWPLTTATYPSAPGADIEPVLNANGDLTISPDVQSAMDAQALAAMNQVSTSNSESTWWIDGAIEAEVGQGFQVVGAGSYPIAFHVDSESSTTAQVNVRTATWEHQVYQRSDGSLVDHTINSQEIWLLTLTMNQVGQWQVNSQAMGFVPGQGP